MTAPVTYTFDVVTVTTIRVTVSGGEEAARAAIAGLESLDIDAVITGTEGGAEDASYSPTCISPRGKAALVHATGAHGEDMPVEEDEGLAEPLFSTGEARELITDGCDDHGGEEAARDAPDTPLTVYVVTEGADIECCEHHGAFSTPEKATGYVNASAKGGAHWYANPFHARSRHGGSEWTIVPMILDELTPNTHQEAS